MPAPTAPSQPTYPGQYVNWANFYGGNVQAPPPTPASYFNYATLGPPPINGPPTGGWTNPQAWANYYQGTNGFTPPTGGNTPAAALGAENLASYSPNNPALLGWEQTYGNPNTALQQNQSWAQSLGNPPQDGNYNQGNGGWTNPNAWASYYAGDHGFSAPTGAGTPAAALAAAAALSKSSPYDPNLLGWEMDFGQPGNILAANPDWASSLGTPQTNTQGIGIPEGYNTGAGSWESPLAWAAYYGGIQGYGSPVNNTLQGAQSEAGVTDPHDPSLLGWELDYGNPQTVVNTITSSQVYKDYIAALAQYQQQQQQYQQQLDQQRAQVANEQAWYTAFANNPQGYFSSSFLSHILGEQGTDPQRAAYEALYGDPNWISEFTSSPANSQYYWPVDAPTVRQDLAAGTSVPFTTAWQSEYGPPSVWYNEGQPSLAHTLPPTQGAIWTYKGPGRQGALNDVNTQNLEATQLNASGNLPPNTVADFVTLQNGKPALDYLVSFGGQSVFAPPGSQITFTTNQTPGVSVAPNGTLQLPNGIGVGSGGNLTSVGGVNVSQFSEPDSTGQPVTTQPIVLPGGLVASPGTPIETIQTIEAQQAQVQAAINSGARGGGLIPQSYTDALNFQRSLAIHNAQNPVHPYTEVAPGTGSYPNTGFGQANMTPFGSSLDPGNYLNNVISALEANASPQMQAAAAAIIGAWSSGVGAPGAQNYNPAAQGPGVAFQNPYGINPFDASFLSGGLGDEIPSYIYDTNAGDAAWLSNIIQYSQPPVEAVAPVAEDIRPQGNVGDVSGPVTAPDWFNLPSIGDIASTVAGWLAPSGPAPTPAEPFTPPGLPTIGDDLRSVTTGIGEALPNWLTGYSSADIPFLTPETNQTAPGVAVTPYTPLTGSTPPETEISPQTAQEVGAPPSEPTFAQLAPPSLEPTFASYAPTGVYSPEALPSAMPEIGSPDLYQGGYGQPTLDQLPPPAVQTNAEQFVEKYGPTTTLRQVLSGATPEMLQGHSLDTVLWALGKGVDTPIDLTNPNFLEQLGTALTEGGGWGGDKVVSGLRAAMTGGPQAIADAASDVQQDVQEGPGAYGQAYTTVPIYGSPTPNLAPNYNPTGLVPPANIPVPLPSTPYDVGRGYGGGNTAAAPSFVLTTAQATSGAPMDVLQQAAAMVRGGQNTAQLQQWMASQGYPQWFNWCAEFVSAIQQSMGNAPPAAVPYGEPGGPRITSAWTTWGQPTENPQPGDVLVKGGGGNVGQGGHAGVVYQADPNGQITFIQGNPAKLTTTTADQLQQQGYQFRTAPGEISQQATDLFNPAVPIDWNTTGLGEIPGFAPPPIQAGYNYPSGTFSGAQPIQAGYDYPPGSFAGADHGIPAGYSYLPGSFGEIDPYNFSSVPIPAGAYGGGSPVDLSGIGGVPPPGNIQAGYSYIPGAFGEVDPYNFSSAPIPAGAYGGGGFPDAAQLLGFGDVLGPGLTPLPQEGANIRPSEEDTWPLQPSSFSGTDWSRFNPTPTPNVEDVRSGYIPAAEPDSVDFQWDTPDPFNPPPVEGPGYGGYNTGEVGGGIRGIPPQETQYGYPEPAPLGFTSPDYGGLLPEVDYTLPGIDQGSTIPGTNYAAPSDVWSAAYGNQPAAAPPDPWAMAYGNQRDEGTPDPVAVAEQRGVPAAQGGGDIRGRTTIAAIEQDPASMAAIQRFAAALPGITNPVEQLFNLIAGESSFNGNAVTGSYRGYLQMSTAEAGGDPLQMTFAEQIDAYTNYLLRQAPQATDIGLFNAASNPALQTQPNDTVVYRAGSAAAARGARGNGDTWGLYSPDGVRNPYGPGEAGRNITIAGIKAYYARNQAATNIGLGTAGNPQPFAPANVLGR